ncbi:unnamed protein product [Ectocarpus sp. 12 AP-2014]
MAFPARFSSKAPSTSSPAGPAEKLKREGANGDGVRGWLEVAPAAARRGESMMVGGDRGGGGGGGGGGAAAAKKPAALSLQAAAKVRKPRPSKPAVPVAAIFDKEDSGERPLSPRSRAATPKSDQADPPADGKISPRGRTTRWDVKQPTS